MWCSLKRKEILTPATRWMNLEDMMLSDVSRTRRTDTVWFCVYEVARNSQRRKVGRSSAGAGGGEMGSSCLMGTEFWLGRWESSGEGWYWGWHNNGNVFNATELYTYKWFKWCFYYVFLPQFKKKWKLATTPKSSRCVQSSLLWKEQALCSSPSALVVLTQWLWEQSPSTPYTPGS